MYKLALWLALLAVTEALSQGVLNTTDVNISQINESVLYNTAPNETEAQIYIPESTLPP
ncbi:jg20504, partial [Pararge aegeria aegeria]